MVLTSVLIKTIISIFITPRFLLIMALAWVEGNEVVITTKRETITTATAALIVSPGWIALQRVDGILWSYLQLRMTEACRTGNWHIDGAGNTKSSSIVFDEGWIKKASKVQPRSKIFSHYSVSVESVIACVVEMIERSTAGNPRLSRRSI
jgi:hypothetical protein